MASLQTTWAYANKDPIMNIELKDIIDNLQDTESSPFVILDVRTKEEIDA